MKQGTRPLNDINRLGYLDGVSPNRHIETVRILPVEKQTLQKEMDKNKPIESSGIPIEEFMKLIPIEWHEEDLIKHGDTITLSDWIQTVYGLSNSRSSVPYCFMHFYKNSFDEELNNIFLRALTDFSNTLVNYSSKPIDPKEKLKQDLANFHFIFEKTELRQLCVYIYVLRHAGLAEELSIVNEDKVLLKFNTSTANNFTHEFYQDNLSSIVSLFRNFKPLNLLSPNILNKPTAIALDKFTASFFHNNSRIDKKNVDEFFNAFEYVRRTLNIEHEGEYTHKADIPLVVRNESIYLLLKHINLDYEGVFVKVLDYSSDYVTIEFTSKMVWELNETLVDIKKFHGLLLEADEFAKPTSISSTVVACNHDEG